MEVGIAVVDLDRMLDFYTTVLSCTEVRRADIPASLTQALTSGQDGYLAVWLRTPGGEVVKLFAPPSPPERVAAPEQLTARTGIGFVTFYCSDLTATLAAAEEKGGVLRSDRKLIAEGAALRLCFFADPEGNIVELVEKAEEKDL
jgi:catechol 2,3-dioxygenase-like lactoylglutathione lyase family enzyme